MGFAVPSPFGAFGNGIGNGVGIPQAHQQQRGMMGPSAIGGPGGSIGLDIGMAQLQQHQAGGGGPGDVASPVDIAALVAAKGYNPSTFDTRPQSVRVLEFSCRIRTKADWSPTGPILCHQVVYRGRCAQVSEI